MFRDRACPAQSLMQGQPGALLVLARRYVLPRNGRIVLAFVK